MLYVICISDTMELCGTKINDLPGMQSVLSLQQWVMVVVATEVLEQRAPQNDYWQFPWYELLEEHGGGSNLKDWVLVVSHNDNPYMLSLSNTDRLSV